MKEKRMSENYSAEVHSRFHDVNSKLQLILKQWDSFQICEFRTLSQPVSCLMKGDYKGATVKIPTENGGKFLT